MPFRFGSFFLAALTLLSFSRPAGAQNDLAAEFKNPPQSARPHTWWHWMNGNITREGITADLEAMKQIGLGGAQNFNVSEGIPLGPVKYMSPEWRDLVKHATSEAKRLGLEYCLHNCAGWSSSGGPWITPEFAMQQVTISETKIKAGPEEIDVLLPQPETKQGFYRDIAVVAFPSPKDDKARVKDIKFKAGFESRYGQSPDTADYPADAAIKTDSLFVLTKLMGADGRIKTHLPAGDFTILRIGHTPTGAVNAPAPESGRGLECDKLSKAGMDAHWAGMLGPIIKDLGPLASQSLNNALIDSYEVGHQNWTANFRDEFEKRRGYDPIPWLPAFTGRVVRSGPETERFLWDVRRTIGDLFADNYYSYFAELCHKNGLKASIEPYDGPFECLLSGRDADIPMGEFWVGGGESNSCKLAAAVAHTYGRTIVGAESFTAEPKVGKWQNHPFALKAVGDLMYTVGINRYIIHRYAHQPWLDQFPGMTMGQWGTHFERTTTWWNQGAAWIQYLARCQYLLQQGLFVADGCYYAGEAAPNDAPFNPALKLKGYDYDACNTDVLMRRMSVKDGRLVLPDGMSYRVLVLPDSKFMTPGTLARIKELVTAGATVIGPKPTQSPSLSGYPQCDADVKKLADEVWGNSDGKTVKQHELGTGHVLWGTGPEDALATMKVQPDCEFGPAKKMVWIHRATQDADIYFVSNQMQRSRDVQCTFRISGKTPELWHADTGEMEDAPLWSESDGRTNVSIHFDPAGSVFVVFRKPAAGEHFVALKTPASAAAEAAAPKIEIRKAMYEAVDGTGGTDVTAKVAARVAAGETSIPSDNATYGDPTYLHVKHLRVEYVLNGKPMKGEVGENETLELVADGSSQDSGLPATRFARNNMGKLELHALLPGSYELTSASGKSRKEAASVPGGGIPIAGPWKLSFPPNWGAPASVTLDQLSSWTQHSDPGVKYFSGSATYETEFDIVSDILTEKRSIYLDLGAVREIAEVTLNGKSLGVWWKPPFAAEVTGIAKPGKNVLQVRVTNLWVNRLIGDEQLPEDVEWNGITLKKWPQWLLDHTKRTSGRLTFTTWHHWTKDSKLMESGLIGPVQLRLADRIPLE